MRHSGLLAVATLTGSLAVLFSGPVASQDSGPTGPSPYHVVEAWHKPFAKQGFAFGGNSGVFAESPDRIFIAQRGETRLPIAIPPEFAGFAGSLGINVLRATDWRTWQNCLYTIDGDGNVIDIWDRWDYLCAGSEGPGGRRLLSRGRPLLQLLEPVEHDADRRRMLVIRINGHVGSCRFRTAKDWRTVAIKTRPWVASFCRCAPASRSAGNPSGGRAALEGRGRMQ